MRKLTGIKSVSNLSNKDYNTYKKKLEQMGLIRPDYMPVGLMQQVYENDQFVDRFGKETFNQLNQAQRRYKLQSALFQDDLKREFSPYTNEVDYTDTYENKHYKVDPNKGVGDEATWIKIMHMTPEGQKQLYLSNYMIPDEQTERSRKAWEQQQKTLQYQQNLAKKANEGGFGWKALKVADDLLGWTLPGSRVDEGLYKQAEEAYKKRNDKIAEKILNEDHKRVRGALSGEESANLQKLNNIDDEKAIDKMFYESLNDEYFGNPLFKEFFKEGKDVHDSLKGFNADEKKKYLALYQTLKDNMDPLSAQETLVNYAKEYISDHSSNSQWWNNLVNDVGISALSYTADKVNGLIALGKMWDTKKYDVFQDQQGNAYPVSKVRKDDKGNYYYKDEEGNNIPVHKAKMSNLELFQQGKGRDGNDKDWFLNNQFWTNAEQWGTMNEKLQKEYAKAGFSREKNVYKAGDESDIIYESLKMSSFALADAAASIIPYAIGGVGGAIGKGGSALTKLGTVSKAANYLGKAANVTAKALSGTSKAITGAMPAVSAIGIGNAYGRGAYQENIMNNINKLEGYAQEHGKQLFVDKYTNDNGFKSEVDKATYKEYARLKKEFEQNLAASGRVLSQQEMDAYDEDLNKQAVDNVTNNYVQNNINDIKNSGEYANMINKATESATTGAMTASVTDAIKYLPVNYLGHRSFLFKSQGAQVSKTTQSLLSKIKEAGNRILVDPKAIQIYKQGIKSKAKAGLRIAKDQFVGGAWTNYTDELQSAGGRRINDDMFAAYMNGMYNPKAVNATYSLGDAINSYLMGAMSTVDEPSSLQAGLVGGLGSIMSLGPNPERVMGLAFNKQAREQFKQSLNILRHKNVAEGEAGAENNVTAGDRAGALLNVVNTFVQNGILSEYEAQKIAEQEILDNIDTVNTILDDYDEFKSVEDAVALNLAELDVTNEKDKRIVTFLQALKSLHLLNKFNGADSKESTTLDMTAAKSSAFENARKGWEDIQKLAEGNLSEDDVENYLSQYYNRNPNETRSDENDAQALQQMKENAQYIVETQQLYDEAKKEVDEIESQRDNPIHPDIKEKLIQRRALSPFLEKEINGIQQEALGRDVSEDEYDTSNDPIESYGSNRSVKNYINGLDVAAKQTEKNRQKNQETIDNKRKEAIEYLEQHGVTVSEEEFDEFTAPLDQLTTEEIKEYNELRVQYENAKLNDVYYEQTISKLNNDKVAVQEKQANREGSTVLTADEIISLSPTARARMLSATNYGNYNKAQQTQIRKAIRKLNKIDATNKKAAQSGETTIAQSRDKRSLVEKLVDQADLIRHKQANDDAYAMVSENPEAAVVQVEMQRGAQSLQAANAFFESRMENLNRTLRQAREGMLRQQGQAQNQVQIDNLKKQERETLKKSLSKFRSPELKYALEHADRFPYIKENEDLIRNAVEWDDFTTDIVRSIQNNTELTAEEKQAFVYDLDNRILHDVDTKAEGLQRLESMLKDAEESDPNGYHSRLYRRLLEDITGIEHQKSATNKTTAKEQSDRDWAQKERDNALAAAIKEAEKENSIIGIQKEGEGGTLYRGEYMIQPNYYTNKAGKKVLKYTDVTHQGDKETQWHISGEELEQLGITPEDILGPKGKYAKEAQEYYDMQAQDIKENGVSVDALRIGNDNNVSVFMGDMAAEGETARKIFGHITKFKKDGKVIDMTPNDFIKETQEQGQKKQEGSKGDKQQGEDNIEQMEGDMEDTGQQQGDMIESMEDVPQSQQVSQEELEAKLKEAEVEELLESPDVSEQANDQSGTKPTVEITLAQDTTNNGNKMPPNDQYNLLGNPFSMYDSSLLSDKARRKEAKRILDNERSLMAKYFNWCEANKVDVQGIIDRELHRILQVNPRIQFMRLTLNNNEFLDGSMHDMALLVVEHTNEVAKIHDSSRGGVMKANGKEYLIVGLMGFDPKANRTQGDAYRDFLEHTLKAQARQYFDAHPNERAFVNPNVETEVQHIQSGLLVGEADEDTQREVRSIVELLEGEEKDVRNPNHLTLQSLKWMIQEATQAAIVNFNKGEIYHTPKDAPSTNGAVFAMIPGCNGHYLPVYINPTTYNELAESDLKELIKVEFRKLANPDYNVRREAITNLRQLLVLTKEGSKQILIGTETIPTLTIKQNSLQEKTFNLNNTQTTMDDIMQAIEDAHFRINITRSVLENESLLRMYAEAGALNTDVAKLAAVNAGYSIFAVGADGKANKVNVIDNNVQGPDVKVDTKRAEEKAKSTVIYNNKTYRKKGNTWTTTQATNEGEREINVTDPIIVKQLELASYLRSSQLQPCLTEKVSGIDGKVQYFIINSDKQNPRVLQQNTKTDFIIDMTPAEATKFLERMEKINQQDQMDKKAEQVVNNQDNIDNVQTQGNQDEIHAETDEGTIIDDEQLMYEGTLGYYDGEHYEGEMTTNLDETEEENLIEDNEAQAQDDSSPYTQAMKRLETSDKPWLYDAIIDTIANGKNNDVAIFSTREKAEQWLKQRVQDREQQLSQQELSDIKTALDFIYKEVTPKAQEGTRQQQGNQQAWINTSQLDIRGSLGLASADIGPGYTAHYGPRTSQTGIGSGDPRSVARRQNLPKNTPSFIGNTMYIPESANFVKNNQAQSYHLMKGTGRDDWESVTFPRELSQAEQQIAINWVLQNGANVRTWREFAYGLSAAINNANRQSTKQPIVQSQRQPLKQESRSDGGINDTAVRSDASKLETHTIRSMWIQPQVKNRIKEILIQKGMDPKEANRSKAVEAKIKELGLPTENIPDIEQWINDLKGCH